MLEALTCRLCGGDLQNKDDGIYVCPHCGHTFVKKAEDDYATVLKSLIDDSKLERLSAARQNLWTAMHEEYISSSSCFEYARDLKSLVPSDYYANFAEIANSKNDADLSKFMNSSSPEDMETYADAVLDFMLKSLTAGTLTAVCAYIDRAYKKSSPEYVKYVEAFEREAEKVSQGVYELSMERDVFLAYSSADTGKVIELCDFLESQGISCFLSMRNLRHGRGAADNYDAALREAMNNCRTVVFLSSKSSRNLSCDALRKELPYMRTRDMEFAPSEYKNLSYDKLPARYKKPRVEYLLDDYTGTTADALAKQIFDGYEWCKSKEEVAERVVGYLTAVPVTGSSPIGEEDVRKIVSSMSEGKDSSVPLETKEKNILEHVSKLVEIGSFEEALKNLTDLEKEEIEAYSKASAGVYYYKILSRHGAKGFKEIVKAVTSTGDTLRNDADYSLAMSCGDGEYKDKIKEIEARCEEINAQAEKEAENERLKKEQAARETHEMLQMREAERIEEERVRALKKTHLNLAVIISVLGVVVLLIVASLIVSLTVTSAAGGAMFMTTVFVTAFTGIILLLLLAWPIRNKTAIALTIVMIAIGFVCIYPAVVFLPGGAERKRTIDGVLYDVNYNYCRVLGYDDASGDVVIPSEIEGKPVTVIKKDAFEKNTDITSVTIPDTVTKIESYAFNACTSLKTVTMEGNVKKIGECAFLNCDSLVGIDLSGVTKFGKEAFETCDSLKNVILSDELKTIPKRMFYNCYSLTEITIPASVKTIGEDAFYRCKLSYVYFEDPYGWKIDGEKVDSELLSDPSSAAALLYDEGKTWKH